MSDSHATSTSDLDLDGVPGSHRHGIRALRARLSGVDGISIDHVTSGHCTRVFLSVNKSSELMSIFGLRTAFRGTGVEKVNMQFGNLHCIVLDGPIGFEV
jgi:hypothetical protein